MKQIKKPSNSSISKKKQKEKEKDKQKEKDTKTKDRILDNLILDVQNVKIRYEDGADSFTCLIQMDQLTLHTTDASWERQHFSKAKHSKHIFRLAKITILLLFFEVQGLHVDVRSLLFLIHPVGGFPLHATNAFLHAVH